MKPKISGRHPCLIQNFLNLTSHGQLREAVDYLFLLYRKGFSLNTKQLASLLRQCGDSKASSEGRWVHLHLRITRYKHIGTFLSNHLINMFSKCGDHVKAREVFDKMRDRNLYSWNNMLSGYANLGMAKAARRLFDKMPERDFVSWNAMVMAYVQGRRFDEAVRIYMELRRSGIGYNEYSFAGVLTVCVKWRKIWLVKQMHCQVLVVGFLSNVVLSSSVLDAYAKCGELGDARRLFDEMEQKDVLTWTTLISGYAQQGDMKSARGIFDSMPDRNPVSWTSLITGYTQNGMGRIVLKLFTNMINLHVEPDQFTFSSCFLACASIISLEHGRQIHSYIIRLGLRPNDVVISSLIEMYSKCGDLEVGKRVFDTVENKHNVVLWNTIISSLAHHGCGRQSLKMFNDMVRLGVKPEGVTFLALVKACSHSGLVEEGLRLFEIMTSVYKIAPDQEHYACLIDLLGRYGCFDEVMSQIKKMPCKPDDRVWNALLGVCRIHGNVELGRIAARHLVELEPRSPAAYLMLSSIYASHGKWELAEEVRRLMKERSVEKEMGLSWIEIDRKLQYNAKPDSCKFYFPENVKNSALELLD